MHLLFVGHLDIQVDLPSQNFEEALEAYFWMRFLALAWNHTCLNAHTMDGTSTTVDTAKMQVCNVMIGIQLACVLFYTPSVTHMGIASSHGAAAAAQCVKNSGDEQTAQP